MESQTDKPNAFKILLVEDETIFLELLTAHLEAIGHTVVGMTSASSAWRLIEAGLDFEVLVSDIMMPGDLNGIDLAERIQTKFGIIPTILLTGHSSIGVPDNFPQDPIILRKPFSPVELQDALQSFA